MPLLDSLGSPLPPMPKAADAWEKARTISTMVSAVVIPVVLLWVGNSFSSALKERELQGKFVELAVRILSEEPTKQAAGLRDWATQVLNNYSGVPFAPETKKALIETTPLPLPATAARYEGRKELGNVEAGDGAKFVGRGYLMIVGRSNYERFSKLLGVDLVTNPEVAAEPGVAARVMARWFKDREDGFAQALAQGDLAAARRVFNGSTRLSDPVAARYAIYLARLERSPTAPDWEGLDGIRNPAWVSVHLPALMAALDELQVASRPVRAYALATADIETVQGRFMKER